MPFDAPLLLIAFSVWFFLEQKEERQTQIVIIMNAFCSGGQANRKEQGALPFVFTVSRVGNLAQNNVYLGGIDEGRHIGPGCCVRPGIPRNDELQVIPGIDRVAEAIGRPGQDQISALHQGKG